MKITHVGTDAADVMWSALMGTSFRTDCSATSSPTMMPIVFWESLLPCESDIAAAETSCSRRNERSTLRGSERRSSHDSPTVMRKAINMPSTGDTTMKMSVDTHLPGHTTATIP